VWVDKPSPGAGLVRVLAALNPDGEDAENRELNARVLEVAEALSHSANGELHVVHAWTLENEPVLRHRAGLPPQRVAELLRERRIRAAAELERTLKRLTPAIRRIRIHLRKGDPSRAIAKLASKQRIGVVVAGNRGRRGLSRLLAANTAEMLVQEAPCPVVAVRGPQSGGLARTQAA
jgi:nucleotide-binding universal stress UspA family protein